MDWENSEYLDEAAFEQYLFEQGVTREELEADLNDHLTLNTQPYGGKCYSFKKDGESFQVYAEGIEIPYGGISITRWLDSMPIETLLWFWEKPQERNKIKSLMRYPGAYHEWLMLAAIPMLKVMGIPMGEIMRYRTLTDRCWFLFDGKQCWHGGAGSTTMHNDLFMEIGNAYLECARRKVHHSFPVLRKYLRRFAWKYYGKETKNIPDALKALTGM